MLKLHNLPTIWNLSPFCTSSGPPLSPWHESVAARPAHNWKSRRKQVAWQLNIVNNVQRSKQRSSDLGSQTFSPLIAVKRNKTIERNFERNRVCQIGITADSDSHYEIRKSKSVPYSLSFSYYNICTSAPSSKMFTYEYGSPQSRTLIIDAFVDV